jgi:hypothetical protein
MLCRFQATEKTAMALSAELRTALERSRSRLRSPKQPSGNGAAQTSEQRHGVEELVRQARAAGHTGPLVLGPSRSDFGPPRNPPSSAPCAERSLCPGLVDSASREEPQYPSVAPESPQSAPVALPTPPSIPCLPSSFWWALLFGNPDSPVSSSNATQALQLVSDKLGVPIADGETIDQRASWPVAQTAPRATRTSS